MCYIYIYSEGKLLTNLFRTNGRFYKIINFRSESAFFFIVHMCD